MHAFDLERWDITRGIAHVIPWDLFKRQYKCIVHQQILPVILLGIVLGHYEEASRTKIQTIEDHERSVEANPECLRLLGKMLRHQMHFS